MWSEKMMFEGDIREEYAEWLSKMKNATIIPDSGGAITISKNVGSGFQAVRTPV